MRDCGHRLRSLAPLKSATVDKSGSLLLRDIPTGLPILLLKAEVCWCGYRCGVRFEGFGRFAARGLHPSLLRFEADDPSTFGCHIQTWWNLYLSHVIISLDILYTHTHTHTYIYILRFWNKLISYVNFELYILIWFKWNVFCRQVDETAQCPTSGKNIYISVNSNDWSRVFVAGYELSEVGHVRDAVVHQIGDAASSWRGDQIEAGPHRGRQRPGCWRAARVDRRHLHPPRLLRLRLR